MANPIVKDDAVEMVNATIAKATLEAPIAYITLFPDHTVIMDPDLQEAPATRDNNAGA